MPTIEYIVYQFKDPPQIPEEQYFQAKRLAEENPRQLIPEIDFFKEFTVVSIYLIFAGIIILSSIITFEAYLLFALLLPYPIVFSIPSFLKFYKSHKSFFLKRIEDLINSNNYTSYLILQQGDRTLARKDYDEFEHKYQSMSDDDLIKLYNERNSLIPELLFVLESEMRGRGLLSDFIHQDSFDERKTKLSHEIAIRISEGESIDSIAMDLRSQGIDIFSMFAMNN